MSSKNSGPQFLSFVSSSSSVAFRKRGDSPQFFHKPRTESIVLDRGYSLPA